MRHVGSHRGSGEHGYRINVRSSIKRIRNKFPSHRSRVRRDRGLCLIRLPLESPEGPHTLAHELPGARARSDCRIRRTTRARGLGRSRTIAGDYLEVLGAWLDAILAGASEYDVNDIADVIARRPQPSYGSGALCSSRPADPTLRASLSRSSRRAAADRLFEQLPAVRASVTLWPPPTGDEALLVEHQRERFGLVLVDASDRQRP